MKGFFKTVAGNQSSIPFDILDYDPYTDSYSWESIIHPL